MAKHLDHPDDILFHIDLVFRVEDQTAALFPQGQDGPYQLRIYVNVDSSSVSELGEMHLGPIGCGCRRVHCWRRSGRYCGPAGAVDKAILSLKELYDY